MKFKEKFIIIANSALMVAIIIYVIISLFIDPEFWICTIILLVIYIILLNTLDGW